MPDQRPSIVFGKGGNQFRYTDGMSRFTEISNGFDVCGSERIRQLVKDECILFLHSSSPFRPQREGGREWRRTVGLCSDGVPTVHITSRVAQAWRSSLFWFTLSQFLACMLATTTAIRFAHSTSSCLGSSSAHNCACTMSGTIRVQSKKSSHLFGGSMLCLNES